MCGGAGLAALRVCGPITTSGGSRPSSTQGSAASGAPAPSRAPQPTAEAHLDAALAWRDEGELGLALEEARQALIVAPPYPAANTFVAPVAPQATATAQADATQGAQASRTQAGQSTADTRAMQHAAAEARSACLTGVSSQVEGMRATAQAAQRTARAQIIGRRPPAPLGTLTAYESRSSAYLMATLPAYATAQARTC